MARIFIVLFLIWVQGCATNAPQEDDAEVVLNSEIENQISSLSSDIKRCFRYHENLSEIILYLNINSSGTVENITILPLTNMATQQCVSMTLGSLRISNDSHQKFKIRKVLRF